MTEGFLLMALPPVLWFFVLLMSRISGMTRDCICSYTFTNKYFELLPCYNAVCRFKFLAGALFLVSYELLDSEPKQSDDDYYSDSDGTATMIAVHLGAAGFGLATGLYAVLWRCFGSSTFGYSDVKVAYMLGGTATAILYVYILSICGWSKSHIKSCSQEKTTWGWAMLAGLTLSSIAIVGFLCSASKNYWCSTTHRDWWSFGLARQPAMTLVTLSIACMFGVSEVVRAYLLSLPSIDMGWKTAFLIATVLQVVEVPVLHRMMRIDSDFWSEITFEPLFADVAKRLGVPTCDAAPRHIKIQDLVIHEAEELGQGATASVYRATCSNKLNQQIGLPPGKQIAVKKFHIAHLSPEDVRNNCFELAVASSLGASRSDWSKEGTCSECPEDIEKGESFCHPCIVQFYGFAVSPPNMYLCMEICEITVAQLLYPEIRPDGFAEQFQFLFDLPLSRTRESDFSTAKAAVLARRRVSAGLAEAITYIHSKGYLHRDIKSDNCMVALDTKDLTSNPSGCTCKLMDWGMAVSENSVTLIEETEATTAAISEQRWGDVFRSGSLQWLAPEMIIHAELRKQPQRCSQASDVYALGMLLFECITRERPDISIRSKLDPEYEYPAVEDKDGFGMSLRLLHLAWEWDPQARCSAAALALNLRGLDTVRRTSNPLISEVHGIHAVTIGDGGRKLQMNTGEINSSTSISITPEFVSPVHGTCLEAIKQAKAKVEMEAAHTGRREHLDIKDQESEIKEQRAADGLIQL